MEEGGEGGERKREERQEVEEEERLGRKEENVGKRRRQNSISGGEKCSWLALVLTGYEAMHVWEVDATYELYLVITEYTCTMY